jgi:hypothetical protein
MSDITGSIKKAIAKQVSEIKSFFFKVYPALGFVGISKTERMFIMICLY